MNGRALVVRGHARTLPLPDASVDLIVTSPPYYALRSYTEGGVHYEGQIGSEATRADYIEALIDCTREWMRVLKPSGSMFVDLGDKYSGYNNGSGKDRSLGGRERREARMPNGLSPNEYGVPAKSLMLLPERYRIAAVDQLGLIARAVIVWMKPNGLPESVGDRVRRSHEDWVHLVRQPRYYSAVDEIREPQVGARDPRTYRLTGTRGADPTAHKGLTEDGVRSYTTVTSDQGREYHPLGKLPGSVWSIPTEPLQVPPHLGIDHFAAFPSEWPRRLILGWSPPGICPEWCEGRRPATMTDYQHVNHTTNAKSNRGAAIHPANRKQPAGFVARSTNTITGYVCACTPDTDHPGTGTGGGWGSYDDAGRSGAPAANGKQHVPANYQPRHGPRREWHLDGWTPPPTRPAIVLDPFGGTGTTALVASVLGRIGITVDRSADYSRLAAWRTQDPGERARALRVEKPAPVAEAQLTLDWEIG